MNTRKTVYDKLFTEKVELASHEVRLTVINNVVGLQKMVKERISLLDKATNEINKTIALNDKLIAEAKTTVQVLNTNTNEVNLLLKQVSQVQGDLHYIVRELNLNVHEIPEMKLLLELKNEMANKFKNEITGKIKIIEAFTK
jgi:DNA repair ATPase RecN